MSTFGEYVKAKRLERGLGLREFCLLVPVDASNFSKIERGKLEPPQPGTQLFEGVCAALKFSGDSDERHELERIAQLQRGMIPQSVLANEQLAAKLPAFFRTIDGAPISEEERQELIDMIRNA
ncbi:MAG: helix-turn-helix domain-containing protein [Fimbriimonadaceae bacterium]|nr:hypothetical protein [Fimbriimonadaceae bacterium]MCL4284700.1 helix-turn-helix domain-containing protein [Fimbriimonadaceae bacterium]QOJ12476.1 MAG: helix-turn-helix domain-containing protein [Chthonomonadaceae bacterium]